MSLRDRQNRDDTMSMVVALVLPPRNDDPGLNMTVHDPSSDGGKLGVRLSWPILVLLVIILLASFGLAALPVILSPSSEISGITAAIAKGNSISRVVTLIVVVPAILMLAIRDQELGAAALSALSAIAGYVLGQTAQ